MSRRNINGDTMKRVGDPHSGVKVHGVRLYDAGSCIVPMGSTITLEEWHRQQARRG